MAKRAKDVVAREEPIRCHVQIYRLRLTRAPTSYLFSIFEMSVREMVVLHVHFQDLYSKAMLMQFDDRALRGNPWFVQGHNLGVLGRA